MINQEESIPLCFRCEHRAVYLTELKLDEKFPHQPRSECGDISKGVYSCYMFQPVKPVILEANKGDKRPRTAGWLFSAREHAAGLADFKLKVKIIGNKLIKYWSDYD